MALLSKTSKKASQEAARTVDNNVDAALAELIDQLPGVSAAMLFDADGFALSGVIRPDGKLEPEAAEAAAMGASLIGAARRALAAGAGAEADAPVRSIWVRNDRQNLYCVEVGEAAYAVVTAEPDVPAGLLMFRIDKWSKLATQAIDSLSLTIPEQLTGSDPARTDRKLVAVEVPVDRIGPVRAGVPSDVTDRDADELEAFEPYVRDEEAPANRPALYAHGSGVVGDEDAALAAESFDLAEAIGIELVAEAEADFAAEALAVEAARPEPPATTVAPAEPAQPLESAWTPPPVPPSPVDLPVPLPAPLGESWAPEAANMANAEAVAEPIAVGFAAAESVADPVASPTVGLAPNRPPVAPTLSDDWVIMETAAGPAVTPVMPAPAPTPAPAPAAQPAFPHLGQALPPQGAPVSFDAPPRGLGPVPPAWMAPAPVAARAPMAQPLAPAARPMAPAPTGRPVTLAPAPLAPAVPRIAAPPAPPFSASPGGRAAWNAPAPAGSPVMVAPPPPMNAPVSFDAPPVVFGGQPPVSPTAYRPMAPRPATQVWSPSVPDELELDRADLPSWGAYGNPNLNAPRS